MVQVFAETEEGIVRRRRVLALLAVIALLGIGAWSVGPIVSAVARHKAERQDVEVSIDSVGFDWGHIWLKGVSIEIPKVPALKLRLNAIQLKPRGLGGVAALVIDGGQIEIDGSVADLKKQLDLWRANRTPGNPNSRGGGDEPRIELSGVDLVWRGAVGPGSEIAIWGLRGDHDGTQERIQFDLARTAAPDASIEVNRFGAEISRSGQARALRGLSTGAVTLQANVDTLVGLVRGVIAQGSERADVDSNPPSPNQTEQSAPPRFGLRRVRSGVELLRAKLQGHLYPGAQLAFDTVVLRLTKDDQTLNIGPASFNASLEDGRFVAKVAPGAAATNETLALGLELPLDGGDAVIRLEGGPVSLARLGIHEGDMWLRNVEHTTLSARTRIVLPANPGRISVEADGELHDWSILQPKLAPDPVNGEKLGWQVRAAATEDGSVLDLNELSLTVGNVKAKLSGSVTHQAGESQLKLHGEVPLVSCQAALDSVPPALIASLHELKMAGTFSFSGNLDVDTAHLDAIAVNWDAKNDCQITATGSDISPERFRSPFQYYVTDSNGDPQLRETGPQTDEWTPLSEISPMLETAVVICEDSRFRRHNGFDEEAIHNALVANVKSGRFARGASTISMQLAKNLYLGREKTLSRKLQEAGLTMLLEQELSKDEILELYFNVIEFGPDIFGIQQAAKHYFNVAPRDLSLMQALYLASILPNPKHSHLDADGKLKEGWADYLHKLMQVAFKIHRITEDELNQGLNETLVTGGHGDAANGAGPLPEEMPPEPVP